MENQIKGEELKCKESAAIFEGHFRMVHKISGRRDMKKDEKRDRR
jgi:hypothetical protein